MVAMTEGLRRTSIIDLTGSGPPETTADHVTGEASDVPSAILPELSAAIQ